MCARLSRESLRRFLAFFGLTLVLCGGLLGCRPGPQAHVGTLGKGLEVDQQELDSRRD